MATAVIKDNHIVVTGVRYFKASAPTMEIGCYGEKRTPVMSANYLERQDRLPAPKIDGRIKRATVVDIDTEKTSKGDFLANINVFGVFGVNGDIAWERTREGEYKLVWLYIERTDLAAAFNDAPKARDNLARYGNDARAVDQVFIAMKAKEALRVQSGTSFDISLKTGKLNLNVKGGSNSSGGTDVSLAPGTCYAYLLAKPHWNKGKTVIEKFTDDQWSLS